jgi:ATP-dependent Lhr-like helicase
MSITQKYFELNRWQPQLFQKQAWEKIIAGDSGLLNAPTGCGKTFAIWFGFLERMAAESSQFSLEIKGIKILWITPLRSLSAEIERATIEVNERLNLPITVALRSGDTSSTLKQKQLKDLPNAMITTVESLHILLSRPGHQEWLSTLDMIVVDEWHELLGTKRGVLMELALSRLLGMIPQLLVWGISATIGNLVQANEILNPYRPSVLVQANLEKKIHVQTIFPDHLDLLPWAGHLGVKMVGKVIDLIHTSNSTLIFTNTRAQSEMWYKAIMDEAPDLAGLVALHHGSLSMEIRQWVETSLHHNKLKAVVCTSSLDLGVDFQPVDTVIQIGSPKGIARFIQRAGRSGHQPDAESNIYFVPTHSLEVIEGAAIRSAVDNKYLESRLPYIRSFDVLCQYLVTLACGGGFKAETIFHEITKTFSFQSITKDEWHWCLQYITTGGGRLEAYEGFQRVAKIKHDLYLVKNKFIANKHRMNIGAIVSGSLIQIKLTNGTQLGVVEDYFFLNLDIGGKFWFAGRCLELVDINGDFAKVRPSKSKSNNVPSYQGGRMPLSSELSKQIRFMLQPDQMNSKEHQFLGPLLHLQEVRSAIPVDNEILIEQFYFDELYHVFIFPFEGRNIHEGLSALFAARISKISPITISYAMNDYGLHLKSDVEIPIQEAILSGLFSLENLANDLMFTLNSAELAKKKFRDIAVISGMLSNGFPGAQQKARFLQANAQLFFNVYKEFEPENILYQQAYDEVLYHQLEYERLRQALNRISEGKLIFTTPDQPSPFSFPIYADQLRERYNSIDFEVQIDKILKRAGIS